MLSFDALTIQAMTLARAQDSAASVAAATWDALLHLPIPRSALPRHEVALPILAETYVNCARRGITSQDSIHDMMMVSLAAGRDVLGMVEFAALLDDPLLHPEAKVRHITMAFAAVSGAAQRA